MQNSGGAEYPRLRPLGMLPGLDRPGATSWLPRKTPQKGRGRRGRNGIDTVTRIGIAFDSLPLLSYLILVSVLVFVVEWNSLG